MAHPVSQKWFLSSLTNEPVPVNMTVYMFPLQYWLLSFSKHLSVQTHGSCLCQSAHSIFTDTNKGKLVLYLNSQSQRKSTQYSLEGLMLNLKLQYFGHLTWRVDSLEKTMMLGKLRGGEGSNREWGGWMASPTQWT